MLLKYKEIQKDRFFEFAIDRIPVIRNNSEIIFIAKKSFCVWGFSGPYFPACGLNTEIYR